MPSGLIALLDDVAGIAKLAAASIDDVGAAAGRASTKAAGVVIDDAAVTPRYVTGLSPSRELPIIGKIAAGSIRNKLLIILPVALLLTSFAPWAITPILMCGGAFEAAVLIVVGLAMTVAVYGVVGLIVKMDDIGLHLAERPSRAARAFGRGLVKAMPAVMSGLSTIGTVAMLWVGGGILLHGSHTLGLAWPAEPVEHLAHAVATALGPVGPVAGWLTTAVISGVIGVVVGGLIALVLHHAMRLKPGAGH